MDIQMEIAFYHNSQWTLAKEILEHGFRLMNTTTELALPAPTTLLPGLPVSAHCCRTI